MKIYSVILTLLNTKNNVIAYYWYMNLKYIFNVLHLISYSAHDVKYKKKICFLKL